MNLSNLLFSQLLSKYIISPQDYQYIKQQQLQGDVLIQWVDRHCYLIGPGNINHNIEVYKRRPDALKTSFDHDYYQWLQYPRPKIYPRKLPISPKIQLELRQTVKYSPTLTQLLGIPNSQVVQSDQIIKALHYYIRRHRLQDPHNFSIIHISKDSSLYQLIPEQQVSVYNLKDCLIKYKLLEII